MSKIKKGDVVILKSEQSPKWVVDEVLEPNAVTHYKHTIIVCAFYHEADREIYTMKIDEHLLKTVSE